MAAHSLGAESGPPTYRMASYELGEVGSVYIAERGGKENSSRVVALGANGVSTLLLGHFSIVDIV